MIRLTNVDASVLSEVERKVDQEGISTALENVLHIETSNAATSTKKSQAFIQGTLLKRGFIRANATDEKHEAKARKSRRRSKETSPSIDGAFDFSSMRKGKAGQHMPSTREWLFHEVRQWYLRQMQITENDTSAAQASDLHIPFWLTGDGGTGKSVVSAVLLERLKEDAVAWHFCRHDNLSQSEPADVLRSMSAMMCARLPGFAAAKAKQSQEKLNLAKKSMDLDDIFDPLLAEPLKVLETPTQPKLIVLDALDELPQGPPRTKMLRAITSYFSKLPK